MGWLTCLHQVRQKHTFRWSFVLLPLGWRHVFHIWSGARRSRWEKWIALHPTEVCNLSFTFQISGSSVHWNHRIGDLLPLRWVEAVSHLLFMVTPRFVMSQLLFTICQRLHRVCCVGKSTWGFQSLIKQKRLKGTNSFLAKVPEQKHSKLKALTALINICN